MAHLEKELPKSNFPEDVIKALVFMLRLFTVISAKYQAKDKQIVEKRKDVEREIREKFKIKSLYNPFFSEKV